MRRGWGKKIFAIWDRFQKTLSPCLAGVKREEKISNKAGETVTSKAAISMSKKKVLAKDNVVSLGNPQHMQLLLLLE